MALDYFSFYAEQQDFIKELNIEERGELFTGIFQYAFDGEIPEFKTNAKYVFPFFKSMIDKCSDKHETQKANGSKGGRPRKEDNPRNDNNNQTESEENPIKTQNNPSKTQINPTETQTKPNESETVYKDKDNIVVVVEDNNNININNNNNNNIQSNEDELLRIQEEQDQVLDKARECGMGNNDHERYLIIDLYTQYGLDRVMSAFDSCVEHGATTVAYLRGVLKNKPKEAYKTGRKRVEAQNFSQRNYDDADDMDRMMMEAMQ